MRTLLRRLLYLLRRSRYDADLREEMETHRALRQDHLERQGVPPADAARTSRRALGNLTLAREDARQVWLLRELESLWQDARHSVRTFARRPLMWSVAILSLALGIGVNAATFSLYDQILRRQLPVAEPERLVNLTATGPRPGAKETGRAGGEDAIFSLPLFRDLERLDDVGLTGLAASAEFPANFAYAADSDAAQGLLVSGGYFEMVGVAPAVGRLIAPSDDRPGADVVVLTDAFWQRRLGAAPDVLGRSLVVNGHPLSIIGVTPAGFAGTTAMGDPPDFFVPLAMTEAMRGDARMDRQVHWLYLSGRLRQGLSIAQAEARLNVPFASITRDVEEPALRGNMGDLERVAILERRLHLEEGSRGRNANRGDVALALVLLSAVAGCVLLIAGANVANLLLARAADRSAEVALRLAIGASSARLVRWLLTEACLIGLLGGVVALVALEATVRIVLAGVDAPMGPVGLEIPRATYLFALALGCGTGIGLGLFPALHGVRSARLAGLQGQGARTSSPRATSRYRTMLATTQMALATALLALAGLFLVSLSHVTRLDLGLDQSGLVVFGVSPGLNGYTAQASDALAVRLEDTLRALPGVRTVATTTLPLLTGSDWEQNLTVEGFPSGEGVDTRANRASVGAGYFRTLEIPVVAGREFSPADTAGAPRVAVVNQAFARKFQLGTEVVGRRMALGAGDLALDIEIVGLVGDSSYSSARETPPPQFFLPRLQDDGGGATLYFYVRAETDAASILGAIRPAVAQLDATLPVRNLRTVEEQLRRSTAPDRLLATLSATVAGLATLLAGMGLYAVLAQTVAVRWRELGIRLALGATTADIRRAIGGQLGRIALTGIIIGGVVAMALGRIGQSLLVGVDGPEPLVLIGAIGIALLVAVLAAVGPTRRATAIKPIDALRAD